MKRIVIALVACAPAIAAAQQAPFSPSGQSPPVNLDPGAEPTQGKEKPPPQQQPQNNSPNVVVVRPDGTVTYQQNPDQGPGGYYIPSGGGAGGAPRDVEIHAGPVPELHVVRRGDTLWDICFYYFNDPWQWPKIWSFNPQITNPHWIYPGDLVRLLPRGVFVTQPSVKDPEDPNAGKKPDRIPPPQRRVDVGIKQIAFVEKDDLERTMKIEGTVDEKVLISNGDSVYISYPEGKPPQIGKRYSIYAPDNQVKNGKDLVGAYVRIYGIVEVQSVRQDKRARGVIVEANKEIERGLLVGPLLRQFKNVPPVQPKADVQGAIIAMLHREQLIGQGEVVFVNLGEGSNVEVGNRMFVVRRGDAYPPSMDRRIGQDDRRYPARELGEIVIVEVGKKVSIGLVTLSVQEIDIGDTVMMQKPK